MSRGVALQSGHQHAHRLAVGLREAGVCRGPEDGVVRVSLLRYNTLAEIDYSNWKFYMALLMSTLCFASGAFGGALVQLVLQGPVQL